MSRTHEKVRDYLTMGVLEVWVVNPGTRSVMVFSGQSMIEVSDGELRVPETAVSIRLSDVFAALDDY